MIGLIIAAAFQFSSVLWLLPSMSSIGVTLVPKCVASSSQEGYKIVLAIYIAAKDIFPALHYLQDRAL